MKVRQIKLLFCSVSFPIPMHLNPLDKRMISKSISEKRKIIILTIDRLDGGIELGIKPTLSVFCFLL